jgi:hypothetical protein
MDLTHARWRKSSYSGNNGGACIEVTAAASTVVVRDSKDQAGPVLVITARGWRQFAALVRNGEHQAG